MSQSASSPKVGGVELGDVEKKGVEITEKLGHLTMHCTAVPAAQRGECGSSDHCPNDLLHTRAVAVDVRIRKVRVQVRRGSGLQVLGLRQIRNAQR
jgi:hypothetical protein